VTTDRLRQDLNTAGFLFETLCLRDLAVFADSSGASVYHYRDESGLEADAIISHPDGRWAAVEVRLGYEPGVHGSGQANA
jgi:hypothetical protein